uniref:Uncharacterized protein n=1 Tax=Chromera velia CCMP2878 TaxID=1169474 RepID=A0A0G4FZ47_9ALVE|eukprot:Cvel_19349.t1-p1 / transcript=Cvel_19349.t1 / gene=Cvel_19349 / organism=Chromera_velia_CCMP2878 / gene_product=hypothetical protein / transcript_product=hypothetical protein / location=Cvel_scaffold1661:32345-36648(-) / protein_length=1221 / sequence_SO=supercontig / SO=protein_coding / is_pseudo=false
MSWTNTVLSETYGEVEKLHECDRILFKVFQDEHAHLLEFLGASELEPGSKEGGGKKGRRGHLMTVGDGALNRADVCPQKAFWLLLNIADWHLAASKLHSHFPKFPGHVTLPGSLRGGSRCLSSRLPMRMLPLELLPIYLPADGQGHYPLPSPCDSADTYLRAQLPTLLFLSQRQQGREGRRSAVGVGILPRSGLCLELDLEEEEVSASLREVSACATGVSASDCSRSSFSSWSSVSETQTAGRDERCVVPLENGGRGKESVHTDEKGEEEEGRHVAPFRVPKAPSLGEEEEEGEGGGEEASRFAEGYADFVCWEDLGGRGGISPFSPSPKTIPGGGGGHHHSPVSSPFPLESLGMRPPSPSGSFGSEGNSPPVGQIRLGSRVPTEFKLASRQAVHPVRAPRGSLWADDDEEEFEEGKGEGDEFCEPLPEFDSSEKMQMDEMVTSVQGNLSSPQVRIEVLSLCSKLISKERLKRIMRRRLRDAEEVEWYGEREEKEHKCKPLIWKGPDAYGTRWELFFLSDGSGFASSICLSPFVFQFRHSFSSHSLTKRRLKVEALTIRRNPSYFLLSLHSGGSPKHATPSASFVSTPTSLNSPHHHHSHHHHHERSKLVALPSCLPDYWYPDDALHLSAFRHMLGADVDKILQVPLEVGGRGALSGCGGEGREALPVLVKQCGRWSAVWMGGSEFYSVQIQPWARRVSCCQNGLVQFGFDRQGRELRVEYTEREPPQCCLIPLSRRREKEKGQERGREKEPKKEYLVKQVPAMLADLRTKQMCSGPSLSFTCQVDCRADEEVVVTVAADPSDPQSPQMFVTVLRAPSQIHTKRGLGIPPGLTPSEDPGTSTATIHRGPASPVRPPAPPSAVSTSTGGQSLSVSAHSGLTGPADDLGSSGGSRRGSTELSHSAATAAVEEEEAPLPSQSEPPLVEQKDVSVPSGEAPSTVAGMSAFALRTHGKGKGPVPVLVPIRSGTAGAGAGGPARRSERKNPEEAETSGGETKGGKFESSNQASACECDGCRVLLTRIYRVVPYRWEERSLACRYARSDWKDGRAFCLEPVPSPEETLGISGKNAEAISLKSAEDFLEQRRRRVAALGEKLRVCGALSRETQRKSVGTDSAMAQRVLASLNVLPTEQGRLNFAFDDGSMDRKLGGDEKILACGGKERYDESGRDKMLLKGREGCRLLCLPLPLPSGLSLEEAARQTVARGTFWHFDVETEKLFVPHLL